MKIKRKFTLYNLIMLLAPIIIIGVISVCFLLIFIMKFPVEELYISRVQLLNPVIFSRVLGEFFKNNPNALLYAVVWIMLCIMVLMVTTTLITRRMTKSVEKPIKELSRAADSIRGGNLDFEVMGSDYDEIDNLCISLDEMRKELKKAQIKEAKIKHERSMLIANISHDIKTPVTSIKGYVSGIKDGVASTPEKLGRYLDTIYSKADTIDNMVNSLSFYSREQLSEGDFNFENTDLTVFLRVFTEDCGLDLERRGVGFTSDIQEEKICVRLDREKISRALLNLIDNGVKYGGENPQIEIAAFTKDNGAYITVKDNGIGIRNKDIDKVFESFYRADASRSVKGSGLGLGIVKEIIERHGGKIWLKSDGKDKGTLATVYLPVTEKEV